MSAAAGLAARAQRARDAAWSQGQRVLRTLRIGRLPSQRPLPRVRIDLGPRLPGAVVRLGVGVVAVADAACVATGPVTWFWAAVGTLLLVVRPGGLVSAGYALGLGFLLALSSGHPFDTRSFLLLFGLHLLVQLSVLAAGVSWSTVVDLRVLVSPARRFLAWQAVAQVLGLVGALLSTVPVAVPWLPVLVGVALTLLAWVLLSGFTGSGEDPRS